MSILCKKKATRFKTECGKNKTVSYGFLHIQVMKLKSVLTFFHNIQLPKTITIVFC